MLKLVARETPGRGRSLMSTIALLYLCLETSGVFEKIWISVEYDDVGWRDGVLTSAKQPQSQLT